MVQPRRQGVALGHLEGDAGVADLGLGAHDPLRQRGRRDQAGMGDGLGRQAADLAQREVEGRVRHAAEVGVHPLHAARVIVGDDGEVDLFPLGHAGSLHRARDGGRAARARAAPTRRQYFRMTPTTTP